MRIAWICGILAVNFVSWCDASAGYEFSISASSTDPFAAVDAPVDTLRTLYLWVTCVDDGLSAFEADVLSSTTPLSFVPAVNVLNVGTPSELMLAVGGCPFGSNLNLLLGEWLVWDDGITFCLTSSAQSGQMTAVDCSSPSPASTIDPQVSGFSSSAAPPCSIGTANCQPAGGGSSGTFGG